jgi:Na+-transporting methylmalonyl-CoA/oxaloacetate decarboxylase beta subunit
MKTQKFLKIAFPIMLVIFAIFAFVQMPLIGTFVLGGVITNGILGGFRGKVGR